MFRTVAWIGKMLGTALGGPGVAVLGDPGLPEESADEQPTFWTYRLIGVAAALLIVLWAGAPLIAVGGVGLASAAILCVSWLRWRR